MGKPVADFATDFDHTDPAWVADPYPIWAHLRETCPVAHTDRYGGAWLPTRHADVMAIARDTEHFSSRTVVMNESRPGPAALPAPIGVAPPITSDPPFHAHARRLLQPAFAPDAVAQLEPSVRRLCAALLEPLAGRRGLDASVEYAEHIPVAVIARLLGFPEEDGELFRGFVSTILESVDLPVEERMARFGPIQAYVEARLEEHRKTPKDDLTSYLLAAEINGEPLSFAHVFGTIVLLVVAGIDTTWSAIGASLWHLATHPDDLARLVAEPALLDTAIEELLRAYAPVTMARLVAEDLDFDGCPMRRGEWVLLSFPAANRDPMIFDEPESIRLDRRYNRHAAFGLGIHRCLGSHLARLELRVALEEFLARFDRFTLDPDAEVLWAPGQVRGPRKLPLVLR